MLSTLWAKIRPKKETSTQKAIKYPLPDEFDQGCASLFFEYSQENEYELSVVMNFSDMRGGTNRNLELKFRQIEAIRYEKEGSGLSQVPPAPHCTNKYFADFVYPALIIENSEWVKQYEDYTNDPVHYLFLSLEDVVHVLSSSQPKITAIATESKDESYDEKLNSLCRQVLNDEILFIDAIYEIVHFGVLGNMPELKPLKEIYKDISHLPLGDQRRLWSAKILKEKESEIMKHEKEARKKALHICKKYISR